MLKMTEEDFEQVLSESWGINMTQSVPETDDKARQGAIVSCRSVVGLAGVIGQANYAASKAGLIGFLNRLPVRVAARNIRVNCIALALSHLTLSRCASRK